MSGPALWIGDRVRGRNRYTGDDVAGTLTATEPGTDGLGYGEVTRPDGSVQWMRLADLSGPRACYRPTPRGGWGEDQVTCANCGRRIYANGPYDTTRLTHRLDRVASRYR